MKLKNLTNYKLCLRILLNGQIAAVLVFSLVAHKGTKVAEAILLLNLSCIAIWNSTGYQHAQYCSPKDLVYSHVLILTNDRILTCMTQWSRAELISPMKNWRVKKQGRNTIEMVWVL